MASPITFLQETREELTKVVWPSQQNVIRLTLLVVLVSLGVGLFIGGLDFFFTWLTEFVIR